MIYSLGALKTSPNLKAEEAEARVLEAVMTARTTLTMKMMNRNSDSTIVNKSKYRSF